MNPAPTRKPRAFTRTELSAVILVLVVLVAVLLVSSLRGIWKQESRWECAWNLGRIGVACRVWAQDHNGHFPAAESSANGGWKELLANADQGTNCWTNYAIMQNELGQSSKLVICPGDERSATISFTNNFDNTHVSYFVGVSANDSYPQSIQSGDRNLGPGPKPDADYGFSPKSGKGNDVAIRIFSGPVPWSASWSLKIHSAGNPLGSGNISLGDGSGQQGSTMDLNRIWLRYAAPTTNWPAGHVPAAPSIRLVFP